MRLALPPRIAGVAWAALFECARSLPFLAVYGATGLHPLLLTLRAVFLALKSAALLYATRPRCSRRCSPTVQSLWGQVGMTVARLNTPKSLTNLELSLVCVISLLKTYDANYMRAGGFGDPCLLAMSADCAQAGLMALYLTPQEWRQAAAGASVSAEIGSHDEAVDGGAGSGEAAEVCVICLDELGQGGEATRLPCGHIFHEGCIGPWVQANGRCPMRCELAVSLRRHASV